MRLANGDMKGFPEPQRLNADGRQELKNVGNFEYRGDYQQGWAHVSCVEVSLVDDTLVLA